MASIKQLDERRYKITVSNGYRPNGKKISKAKTIQVPPGVPKRGIGQYVAHAAEELERSFKTGYAEDGEMTFEEFASRWLNRQTKYAPSTIAAYRRMLEVVYPMIGGIRLNKLRPMALENMLSELRKRKHHGKRINESTAQRYLSVVSAVLSDAKRNEIIAAFDQLNKAEVNVIGTVMNCCETSSHDYYYSYYGEDKGQNNAVAGVNPAVGGAAATGTPAKAKRFKK